MWELYCNKSGCNTHFHFCRLCSPYSQTQQAIHGSHSSLLRKPCRSHTSLCVQSGVLRHRLHKGSRPRAIRQETGNIKRSFHGCGLRVLTVPLARGTMRLPKEGCMLPHMPRWDMQEKSDSCTTKPHSRRNHEGEIRASC